MSKTPSLNYNNKRLGLLKPEINLQKHPSVKSLFQTNDTKEKKEQNIIEQNTNFLSVNNVKDNLINTIKNKSTIGINIISCDHKIIDDKETFFIEQNIENNLKNDKESSNIKIKITPLKYEFNENEKKLDALITKQMAKGEEYKIIEKNFIRLLKVKNENY